MDTNRLKTFSKEARLLLLKGVEQKLNFWGFSKDGKCSAKVEKVSGGYIFRGATFYDESVPKKWDDLAKKVHDKDSYSDIIEETAYTWFNRIMAIKILEMNNYITPVLKYIEGAKIPSLLQEAKRGNVSTGNKELLLTYLKNNDDEKAFEMLLVEFIKTQALIRNVFGHIDDYTGLLLPDTMLTPGGILEFINTTDAITDEDYKKVELIGWLYQFYISDKKDEVFAGFKNNKKARPEDIPAATQIFTPNWIVKYMVENTVGKIWLDYEPDSPLKKQMNYLVESEEASHPEPVIERVNDLTLLDPAAGSGHILIEGFDLMFKMYKESGYSPENAITHILEHNLFGLDISDRAVQLARFAILIKAASYDNGAILKKGLMPHIYAMPYANEFSIEKVKLFLGSAGAQYAVELKNALDGMQDARNIGSALKLTLSKGAREFISKRDKELSATQIDDLYLHEVYDNIKYYLKPLLILTDTFTAVVANPPYMGSGNMNAEMSQYLKDNYPDSKSDLMAVFMEVCLDRLCKKGLMGMINQHSWMFLSSYEKLREKIIDTYEIVSMIHLGPRTFPEIGGEVVQSTTFVLKK